MWNLDLKGLVEIDDIQIKENVAQEYIAFYSCNSYLHKTINVTNPSDKGIPHFLKTALI